MELDSEIKANLILSLQIKDFEAISSILTTSKVPLSALSDSKNLTIFHEMSSCTVPESDLIFFISQLKTHYCDFSQYAQLLNTLSIPEQQSALHMAVKYNKRKLVKEYLALGANYWVKDKNLHSVSHLAAVYGRTTLLAYFYGLGVRFEERDLGGRIPLHLAAMEGHETCSLFLIARCQNVDVQDNEGMTALHYAASSDRYRIARHLVQMGANRLIKDKLGRTAFDIAKEKNSGSITSVLEVTRFTTKLNPCQKSFKKKSNSKTHLISYIILFFIRYTLIFLIISPRQSLGLTIISLLLFISGIILFFTVSTIDPGYILPNPSENIYETYKPEYICPYCEVLQNKNTRHCQSCQKCIKVLPNQDFDHHCPWIHNCVGKNNHKLFILFLSITCFDFLFYTSLIFISFFTSSHHNQILPSSFQIILGALFLTVFLLIFPLWLIQISNLIQNKTTSQRFAFENSNKSLDLEILDNRMMLLPESDGWISQRNSEDYMIEKTEKICCFSRTKREKLTLNINI